MDHTLAALVALWRDPEHVSEVIGKEARRLAETSRYSAEEITAAVYELLEDLEGRGKPRH
jgi:hypothetical protein